MAKLTVDNHSNDHFKLFCTLQLKGVWHFPVYRDKQLTIGNAKRKFNRVYTHNSPHVKEVRLLLT